MPVKNSEEQNHNAIISQRSAWLFIGKVLPVIILFYITILYSRRLSYEDYGRFQSVWMYINILNIIVGFGAPSLILSSEISFLRSFFKKNIKYLASFYSSLAVASFLIFILSTNLFPLSTKLLLVLFTIIQTISIIRETTLLKVKRVKPVFIINLLYSILFLLWHYYVLNEGFELKRLITGVIAISFVKLLAVYIVHHNEKIISVEIQNNAEFKRHWMFFGANDVLGVVSKWIDKVFLVYLLSSADFALYFNGSFEIPLFGLLVSTIGMIALLEISQSLQNTGKILSVFRQCFVLLSNIVFPLFFFLLFFNKELFSTIFINKYDLSLPIFIISICILPVRINNYTVILQCYEKGNKIITGSILDISLAFILMLIMYPFLGTRGIALAVVIATYVQAFYYLYESSKVLKTPVVELIPIKDLGIRFLLAAAIYFLLSLIIQNVTPVTKIIIAGGVTVIIMLIALAFVIKRENVKFS